MNILCRHKDYNIFNVGISRIAVCTKCNKIGICTYKVNSGCVYTIVKWLSKKQLKKYLEEDTIIAKAIQTIYKEVRK